jgi:hypothetical protein
MGLLDFFRRVRQRSSAPAAEAEWLACEALGQLLGLVRDKASDRKLRLFGAACCRRIWHRLPQGPTHLGLVPGLADRLPTLTELGPDWEAVAGHFDFNHEAVELAERYADGHAGRQALLDAIPVFSWYGWRNEPLDGDHAFQTWQVLHPDAIAAAALAAQAAALGSDLPQAVEEKVQVALLRDLLGNPFRPPRPFDPSILAWDDGVVVRLAQAAYDDRPLPSGVLDPPRLAVLADALEEAGLTDPELLEHLRGPGPHVRGCFAVDAVLRRS